MAHVFDYTLALIATIGVGCSPSTNGTNEPEPMATGRIVSIGELARSRAVHTATRLRDGRVLIAGGMDQAGGTSELFDPNTRTFLAGPTLIVPRSGHTATVLPDGHVVIAGGYNGAYVSSTEIFDPQHNTVIAGPNMLEPRTGHLAIALADGRILFAGGVTTDFQFLKSAEIYDPRTNRFTATGALSVPRESHVGALLSDGTVLIVGGHTGRRENIQLYATSERYDPATGRFTASGAMRRARHKHAGVAMLDGRVLITGGSDERDEHGQYRDSELFDGRTGTFADAGVMNRSRYKHEGTMVVLSDGRVLLAGGNGAAEVYDPRTGSFGVVPSSSAMAGSFSTATLLADGSVLITGGYGNGTGPRASAWLYVP